MLRAVRSHPGVTLLELLVALAVVGAGAALVAPALRLPAPAAGAEDGVARARALALRRAEAMTLLVGEDGAWRVVPTRDGTAEPLATGRLPAARIDSVPAELVITPLGDCIAPVRPAVGTAWDPVRCAPVAR
jgi:prepilin-type N-terminal cleavage/methylation domain-containing protein